MPKGTSYIQPAKNTSWETPRDLFNELWAEADGFDCDPCCTPEQYTARRVLEAGGSICVPPDYLAFNGETRPLPENIARDGLTQPWRGKVFMNPPYGLALRKWVPRAVEMVKNGTAESVWALLPSKTDTQWWQEWVLNEVWRDSEREARFSGAADLVRFLKGRLTFGGAPDPAGFASVVVVWR